MLHLCVLLPQEKLCYFVNTDLPNLQKVHAQDVRAGCLALPTKGGRPARGFRLAVHTPKPWKALSL